MYRSSTRDAMDEVNRLIENAEDRLSRLARDARRGSRAHGRSGTGVSEWVSDAAHRMGWHEHTGDHLVEQARDGVRSASDEAWRLGSMASRRVQHELEHRPFIVLAVAVGIGLLAGVLGRRD